MISGIILTFVILLLVMLSVRERVRLHRYREKDWGAVGEAKQSQLSQALANLVGVAGGIYLSLVVMVTFMELRLPERVQFGALSLEPLATVSIIFALAQPYLQRIVNAWRKI